MVVGIVAVSVIPTAVGHLKAKFGKKDAWALFACNPLGGAFDRAALIKH